MLVSDNKTSSNIDPGHRMKMLDAKKQMLSSKNDEYKKLVDKRAEAEKDYNCAFAKELMRARMDDKTPITIVKDLVKGNKEVAKLKIKLEVCIGIERACTESMKDIREAIGADRSILTWLRAEKTTP